MSRGKDWPVSQSPYLDAERYRVCGVWIAAVRPEQAALAIIEEAKSGSPFEVHLCNAYTLSLVGQDTELREALLRADMNLPDGTPVAWLGRRLGTAGPVRGPGLVIDTLRAGGPCGIRHYLYGGAPGVAEKMRSKLLSVYPHAQIVGAETPPYRPISNAELAELAVRIRSSKASIVWVGIGTPRQDYLVPRLASAASVAVVPVGAAFDFISGGTKEAPLIFQGSGFEWFYRLSREPTRLWRRYLFGNIGFVMAAVRAKKRCRKERTEE